MAKSNDHKDDFLNWCDLWDQACQNGIFPKQPKLDRLPELEHDHYDDPLTVYYQNIDRIANEEGLLSEDKKDGPNPIMPDSKGVDSLPRNPWVDEKSIESVADLKRQLYEIECQLIAKEAGGKKWQLKPVQFDDEKDFPKKIATIKKKIDKISDKLGLKEIS